MRGMGGGPHHGRGGESDSRDGDDGVKPLRITDRRMLGWFVEYLGPHWPKVLVGTLATVISTGGRLAPPLLMKYIVDEVITDRDYGNLGRYISWLIAAYLVTSLFSAVRLNVMHILGQRFVFELRLRAYAHLQKLSLGYFESHKTGDIMSRLSNDVNAVEDMVVHGTDEIISNTLTVAGTIVLLVWLKWQLALVALSPVPIFVVALLIFARYIRPLYKKIREDLGDINAELQENIAGIHVVKAFAREDYELANFRRWSREYYRANVKGIRMWSTFFPFVMFVTSMGTVLVLWYGARPVTGGISPLATPGDIVAFVGYLAQFYHPIGMLIRIYDVFNRALAALARIFQIFNEVPEIRDAPDATELKQVEGDVLLEDVSFKYKTGEMVLKNITIHARPGETVALVGRSGAGKTSVINLIPRFYDPLEGRVVIDSHDVREVTQKSLRQHIALVLQETFLFNGTAQENIAYGRLDASDDEIVAAAKAANAHDFIMELPEQYDTQIGERGVKLSGGQKQRIAIARAVLADPRILILDEATSLVDTEAEQQIQEALANLMAGRTVFVIAHRLSTVRNADKIVVIEGGEIAEEADHETLMENGGLYAEMYQRQFRLEDVWGPDQAMPYPE